jgi:hypothetical protein
MWVSFTTLEENIMNKLFLALLGLLLSGCATMSDAGALADLAIVDRTDGQRLQPYYYQGRYWVAGTPGHKYAVAVNNKTAQRLMTVVSVDGVNVVTGETAAPEQNGYVLHPRMNYEINGWRKSTSEVAAFVFTALPDSYAARTDRPDNVGVIGVAVFREWAPPRPPAGMLEPKPFADAASGARSGEAQRESAKDATAAAGAPSSPMAADKPARSASGALPAPEKAMRQQEEKLGTGHGEREGSQVAYTQFRRAGDRPSEMLTIYYDSYANLVARGIIPAASRSVPNPFPAGARFVPDPKG